MIARRSIRAAAICVCLLTTAPSRAASRTFVVALEYSSAPDCPEEAEFRGIVSGRLGYDAFREGASNRVLVQVASQGRSYEGHIEWRDAAGQWQGDRTFPSRSNDCRELIRAMGFALALQIQLLTSAETPPAGGDAATATNSEAIAAPRSPPAAPTNTPPPKQEQAALGATTATEKPTIPEAVIPSPTPTFSLGIGGSVAFGMSTGMVETGRLFSSVAWPFFAIELAAEAGPPATIRRQDGSGFTHQELLASLAGCGSVARWSACLVAKGGEIRIAGRDIDSPHSGSGPLLQAGLRLGVMQALGRRVFLSVRAEGLVTLTSSRVTLDQILLWTSPRFAGTLGLDLGVRFQ